MNQSDKNGRCLRLRNYPDISVKSGTFPAYENQPSMIFSCLQLLLFTIKEYFSFSPARLPLNIILWDILTQFKILTVLKYLRCILHWELWSEQNSGQKFQVTHFAREHISSNSPNTLQTSNVWINMSCLHPIRTWFFVTCLCLDVPDGVHRSAIFGESLPVSGN